MTLIDQLEGFLRQRPNVWIDGHRLAEAGGFFAFRTRVSELRRRRGMDIRNRQCRVTTPDGRAYTVSEYMFVPRQPANLLEIAEAGYDSTTDGEPVSGATC